MRNILIGRSVEDARSQEKSVDDTLLAMDSDRQ